MDNGSLSEGIKLMERQADHFYLVQYIKISRVLPPQLTYVFVLLLIVFLNIHITAMQLWLVSRKYSIWNSSRHDRPRLVTIWFICFLRISCNLDSVKMVITSWEMCVCARACVCACACGFARACSSGAKHCVLKTSKIRTVLLLTFRLH
jgi:hypothetical protein